MKVLLAILGLLALATSASAECAWVVVVWGGALHTDSLGTGRSVWYEE